LRRSVVLYTVGRGTVAATAVHKQQRRRWRRLVNDVAGRCW